MTSEATTTGPAPYAVVTLWDGRRGYFYRSRFAGTPIFQPVGADGCAEGNPELADAEDHELAPERYARKTAFPRKEEREDS